MFVTTRILTITLLIYLALGVEIPAPEHLDLDSHYFVHLLSWEMGPSCPNGVHYSVKIRTLSGNEVVVKECEKVTSPLLCNLTEAFSDVEETYYIYVSAALGSHMSPNSTCDPFKPIQNTTLEPPLLTVTVCNQSLCVSLRAPTEKLHRIYNSFKFQYKLMVSSEDGTKFSVDTKGLETVPLKNLAPGQRYCVNVSIIDRSPSNRSPVCASTPKTANVSDALIFVMFCLLMVLLVMCTPRLVSQCLWHKEHLPAVLGLFQGMNNVIFIPAGEPISVLLVSEERDSVQKIKRIRLEKEMEGEAEEDLKYEKPVAHYLNFQGSSLSIFPLSSSSDLLMNQSQDKQPSPTSTNACHVHTTEPIASPRLEHLPQSTSPLNNCSVVPTHVEKQDRETSTDINLFSVRLGGFSAERHKDDKSSTNKNELGSYPQNPLETVAMGSTWISDVQTQNSKIIGRHILEGDEDEYSGYLSRN